MCTGSKNLVSFVTQNENTGSQYEAASKIKVVFVCFQSVSCRGGVDLIAQFSKCDFWIPVKIWD